MGFVWGQIWIAKGNFIFNSIICWWLSYSILPAVRMFKFQTRASWETITVIALPKLNNNNNHFHSFSFFITKILQRFWWMFRVHWLIIFKTILIKHLLKIILIIKIFFKLFCTIKKCLKFKIFLTYFKYVLKIIYILLFYF